MKEYFHKKKDGKEEHQQYEELKDPSMNDQPIANDKDNNDGAEGTAEIAPAKNEKQNKGNFFSRGLNSMVNSTKTVFLFFCIRFPR